MPQITLTGRPYNIPHFFAELNTANIAIIKCEDLPDGSALTVFFVSEADRNSIQAIYDNHNANVLTPEQQVSADTNSLREYAALAQAHSKTIKALFVAITDADVSSENTNTRFAAIAALIEDVSVTPFAFKNRWNAAFTAESGVSVAGLDLTALLLLTAAQKQRYINFARNFTVHYGLMLLWAG